MTTATISITILVTISGTQELADPSVGITTGEWIDISIDQTEIEEYSSKVGWSRSPLPTLTEEQKNAILKSLGVEVEEALADAR